MNKLLPLFTFSILLLVLIGAQNVFATVNLFEDPIGTNILSSPFGTEIYAEDFILSSDSSVTDIHFYIGDGPGTFVGTNIIYQFYEDGVTEPGAPILGATGTLVNVGISGPVVCGACFFVEGDLPTPVLLTAGTYWIGLQGNSPSQSILSDDSPAGLTARFSTNDGATWSFFSGNGIPLVITGQVVVAVGGIGVPIDTTALLLASAQSMSLWMIPVIAGAVGVGSFYIKTRMNKDQV